MVDDEFGRLSSVMMTMKYGDDMAMMMVMAMVMAMTMVILQVENWTQVLKENGDKWPEDPDPAWNVTKCQHGWNYDRLPNKRGGYGNNHTLAEVVHVPMFKMKPHIHNAMYSEISTGQSMQTHW